MGHQRAIRFPAQKAAVATRDDEQAPVGHPVDAERGRGYAGDDLALTSKIDGDELLGVPV